MTKCEYLAQIDELANLEDGWDMGCPAISPRSIENSRSLVEHLDLRGGYFFPDVNGGIHIEWFSAPGTSLDFDVTPDGMVETFAWSSNYDVCYEITVRFDDYAQLQEIIDKFIGENTR